MMITEQESKRFDELLERLYAVGDPKDVDPSEIFSGEELEEF